MGNATSIFSLTRNLGASVGISITTTLLARGQQRHLNVLSAHVNPYDPQVGVMARGFRSVLMGGGSDSFTASRQSGRQSRRHRGDGLLRRRADIDIAGEDPV